MIMKAYVVNAYGEDVDSMPEEKSTTAPKPNEPLIKVTATSINPIDVRIRAGLMPHVQPPLPVILHADMSGVVVTCGEQVINYQPGDEVYGCIACTQTLIDGIDLSLMHKKGLTLSSVLMLDRLVHPGTATPYCHYLKQLTAMID